jgi:hypothetical protein
MIANNPLSTASGQSLYSAHTSLPLQQLLCKHCEYSLNKPKYESTGVFFNAIRGGVEITFPRKLKRLAASNGCKAAVEKGDLEQVRWYLKRGAKADQAMQNEKDTMKSPSCLLGNRSSSH